MTERDTPPPPDFREVMRHAGEESGDAPPGRARPNNSPYRDGPDQEGRREEAPQKQAPQKQAEHSNGESSSWFEYTDSSAGSGSDPEANKATLDAPPEGLLPTGSETDSPSLSNPTPSARGSTSSPASLVSTPMYRPSRRPPMAVLHVYDDDQRHAELARIRQTPFTIGRQDGELVIGHERQMSRRHARIDRMQEGDSWHWYLGDLRSTNGTFHRVEHTPLHEGTEVLVGGELVRFLEPTDGGYPTLVKVAPSAEEERVTLSEETHLIGVDESACLPFLTKAPYLDPHHYRIERRGGRWWLFDLASTNQLWVAITKRVELTAGSMFQIGEQRFSFHLP